MKLSEIQRRILYAVTLNANASVQEIASIVAARDHVVRRTISLLMEARVFLRRSIWLNTCALGLTHYVVHLEMPLSSLTARKEFLDTVCAFEETSAVIELCGDSQFELRILARDPNHVAQFFEKLVEKFRFPFKIMRFLTVLEIEYSGPREDFNRSLPSGVPLYLGPVASTGVSKAVDETDNLILSALANHKYLNLNEVARHLGMSRTTLQYRISRLESAGIITGHFYLMDPRVFNDFPVCLQVRSRSLREREREALRKFAALHPRVSWIGFFIGEQTAEIYTLVQDIRQVQVVVDDLCSAFSSLIDSVHIVPQLNFFKYSTYPFYSFKTLIGTNKQQQH